MRPRCSGTTRRSCVTHGWRCSTGRPSRPRLRNACGSCTCHSSRACTGPSMWISYAPVNEIVARKHVVFGQHHVLIGPQPGWQEPKVGGGAPPMRLRDHWLVLYHGVSGHRPAEATLPRRVRYVPASPTC
jgi:hypothetical protein